VGVGLFPNFDVAESIVQIVESSLPNPEHRATYAGLYDLFNRAYAALEPLFDGLAAIESAPSAR
jgi:sugar (pentulose or hexulose) kinase